MIFDFLKWLFATPPPPAHKSEAFKRGYLDYYAGQETNPYATDLPQHVEWIKGRDLGARPYNW